LRANITAVPSKERDAGIGRCRSPRCHACCPIGRRPHHQRNFDLPFPPFELELDELLELELDELLLLELEELLELELDELFELEFEELFELELDEPLLLEFEELFELELPANWMNPSVVFDVVFAEFCRSSCTPVASEGRFWWACAAPEVPRMRPSAAVANHVTLRIQLPPCNCSRQDGQAGVMSFTLRSGGPLRRIAFESPRKSGPVRHL
jgi:hypothetical protein